MNADVPLEAITHALFPYDQTRRLVAMLKSYFDDSGTHEGSDVIVMGGLIADEKDWSAFEPKWARLRDDLGIKKMHMSACESGRHDFQNMPREMRDSIISRFSDIICTLNGAMIAVAVSKSVWDKVASQTDLTEIFKQPIDFFFNVCMRKSLEAKRVSVDGPERVIVTFDSKEENKPFWDKVANGYQSIWQDRVAGYAFGSMKDVLPLQAADVVAYETFRLQCDRENIGGDPQPRPNFAKLTAALAYQGGYFSESNLLEYAITISEQSSRTWN